MVGAILANGRTRQGAPALHRGLRHAIRRRAGKNVPVAEVVRLRPGPRPKSHDFGYGYIFPVRSPKASSRKWLTRRDCRTGLLSCPLHTSKSLFGKDMLFVPEGRLRIAQDFSPGPAPGQNPSGVPEGRLNLNRPSGTPEGFWPRTEVLGYSQSSLRDSPGILARGRPRTEVLGYSQSSLRDEKHILSEQTLTCV